MWLLSNRVRFYNKWTRVIVLKIENNRESELHIISKSFNSAFIYCTLYSNVYLEVMIFKRKWEEARSERRNTDNTLWINYKVFHRRKIHIISFYPDRRSSINVFMHVGPIQGTWKMIHNACPFSLYFSLLLEQPFNGNSSSSSWIMRNYKLIFI